MTPDEINKLSRDELLDVMRREGVQVVHSMFATIHLSRLGSHIGALGEDAASQAD